MCHAQNSKNMRIFPCCDDKYQNESQGLILLID